MLPLPYVITEDSGPDEIQGNFDVIKKTLPISRKDIKTETANVVGAAGQPALAGTWQNFDTSTFHGARYWKDAVGVVHVEGLVMGGGGLPSTIFTLPAGYRPLRGHVFAQVGDGAFARVDVAPTGQVIQQIGTNATYLSINLSFRQEQ